MNILVVTFDHLRYDALGCHGNTVVPTPNLDRLAAKSLQFSRCFTQAPVCAPDRYSMATGQYVHTHGVRFNEQLPSAPLHTVAHALQPAGYRRYSLGHMHWTDTAGTPPEFDTGYEEWISMRHWRATMPPDVLARFDWEHGDIPRRTMGGPSTRTREQYWGYHVAQETIRRMEQSAARQEPFFCWTSFWEPHPPFFPPADVYAGIAQKDLKLPATDAFDESAAVVRRQQNWAHLTQVEVCQMIAGYYGLVFLADQYLGMVLDALERLSIAGDTVIIWTADHGEQLWEHKLFTKFVFYEASVHMPLGICAPGLVPGERDELVEHVDLHPTICDLAGVPVPASVEGRSLKPLLSGEAAPPDWRTAVFSEFQNHAMIRTADRKLTVFDDQPEELFDLNADSQELRNLINQPEQQADRQELYERLEEWRR